MKFEARFQLNDSNIVLDYRRCILSFIKKSLSEANQGKYFEEYYSLTKTKPFCFSTVFEHPIFSSKGIFVEERNMRIIISTADTRTGFILFSAFSNQINKEFPLPNRNSMTLKKMRQLQEVHIKSNKILVKMNEPLCIRKHNELTNKDWYYSTKQADEFEQQCDLVIKNQLLTAGFSEEVSSVKMIPIDSKTVCVKHYGINIECSLGTFMLEGNTEILDYLLKSGVGSRRSSGFGVMSLLAEE